jgi:hypothetical protein
MENIFDEENVNTANNYNIKQNVSFSEIKIQATYFKLFKKGLICATKEG